MKVLNIKEYVREKIRNYSTDDMVIVVLKGIDITIYDEQIRVNMDEVLEDKLRYFMTINQNGRKVITYDEYLALYDFVLMQYKSVIILENNTYFNYYPLRVKIATQKLNALLCHYDDEKEGDKYEIGEISELTNIYGNVRSIEGKYYVSYNTNIVSDVKERVYPIFEKYNKAIEEEKVADSSLCYEIIDEEDYLSLLHSIMSDSITQVYVSKKNTTINKVLFEDKLSVLSFIYKDSISFKIGIVSKTKYITGTRPEFLNILRDYWGYESFKKIKVYNMASLNNNSKVVEETSQDDIITSIVEETEKCMKRKDYRDIFVTAPTGAGKSVIFQIPAIYLAEKYNLFTIVISPLIGLMKDQVYNMELNNYKYARTINSDISPIQKQEIINDIADYKCHILYISPESLLSKSDLTQIIGERTLGLMVIDEAHIVTTWGKQFRPDYWYLGDHLSRIKKLQLNRKEMGFIIATFTATAIYGGIENMYEETIQSLKMIDPITYLGFIKRSDISINIEKARLITGRTEYELEKFDQLIEKMDYSLMLNKKMLVYFPTVSLIERFYQYCTSQDLSIYISRYHGQMKAYEKVESYECFLNNETPIMLATKAFGMGIDIDDIEIVAHFAPTGNVCDYVQEIGRAARKQNLKGEAYYKFMRNDFKHINRLHGLSVLKEYQLIEVIRKVYELYQENIRINTGKRISKKRNEMLVDAESFAYIFENPFYSEDDGINKVKTAMLLIQKDFERKFSFSPFHVRPIPLFEIGFFKIDKVSQQRMKRKYGSVLHQVDDNKNICSVNLKRIWEDSFNNKHSFPKFKYMLYSKHKDLDFEFKEYMIPALSVSITFEENYLQHYENCIGALKTIINRSIREERYYSIDGDGGLVDELVKLLSINTYKAKNILETMISAMSVYQRDYSKSMYGKIFSPKPLNSGEIKYKFLNGSFGFFRWIDQGFKYIRDNMKDGTLYLIDQSGNEGFKEKLHILGILESLNILVFKALGGKNSQIYIYVNQTKTMKEIIDKPWNYKNRLLDLVGERHKISVKMLTYLYEGNFTNEKIWELIEDYFLGTIPESVIKETIKN